MRKTVKSDLSREITKKLKTSCPEYVPNDGETMIIFDFMAYLKKVLIKKFKFRRYENMLSHMWNIVASCDTNVFTNMVITSISGSAEICANYGLSYGEIRKQRSNPDP